MPFSDLKLTEYVASSEDFPHLYHAFEHLGATKFSFPKSLKAPDRLYYFFPTSLHIKANAYAKESSRLNQVLIEAEQAGFAFLIIHTQASYQEVEEIFQKLLAEYDPKDWYPDAPDTYHDSGYFYSDAYIKETPVYKHVAKQVADHRPPIKLDHFGFSAIANIGSWVENRRRSMSKEKQDIRN